MNEEIIQLIKLVNQNKTLNEITKITGLTNEQLYKKFLILRNYGYLVDRKYHYDGEISYLLSNPFHNKRDNEITIETPKDIEKIRIIITGDTHLGHIGDSINAADKMMEYCIKKGIHNIFHAGDFFHGIFPHDTNTKIKDPFDQIEYGLNNYPYDNSINTFICLGNHDASFWLEDGIDIKNILLEKRHDLVPMGYGNSKINLLNNTIYINHPIERCNISSLGESISNSIIIKGHSHRFKVVNGTSGIIVYAPTLSSVTTNITEYTPITYPSMIEMELTLSNGVINNAYFQHFLLINNQLIRVGEILSANNNLHNKKRKNIEEDSKNERKPNLTTISRYETTKKEEVKQIIQKKTIDSYKDIKSIDSISSKKVQPKTKILRKIISRCLPKL